MDSQETALSRWSERLGRISLLGIDVVLAGLVTLTGLTSFLISGSFSNRQAGFTFLQGVEQSSLDLRFGLRGTRPHDPRIVIVGIDEKTLQHVGSFPIPRSNYAALVDRLSTDGARVIAFDFTFPTPESDPIKQALQDLQQEIGPSASSDIREKIESLERSSDADMQFAQAVRKSGNVILGHLLLSPERAKSADPKLADEYFNIIWGKAFPQVVKVYGNDKKDFDLGQAWIENHGVVAEGAEANIPILAEVAASYGFLDINQDPDGTLRNATLIERYKNLDFYPSLAVQVVHQFENIPDQEMVARIAEDGLESIQLGDHEIRPNPNGTVLINYRGPYHTYSQFSMWDVIHGEVPPGEFRGKIVLVGATALALGDIRVTPFQEEVPTYMGVEVHANIIDNLLHSNEKARGFLVRGKEEWLFDIIFILFFGIGFGFLFSRLSPLYSTISMLATLALYSWFVDYMFAAQGRWISFVIPAGTLATNYAAITSFRMIFEEREKRKIRKTFSQYLSPGVIGLIEKDPQRYIRPGGQLKELTVMFSDIRSFTTLSEKLTPDELVQLLNEYLGEMTDAIFATNGTLDKYIGDAIMAFWGSPYPQDDHAFRGCSCALQMIRRLEKLNQKWKSEGRWPLSIGIGLNSGPVNVGNMGSAKRLAWTVMGDNVNLASRLEGINKEYQTHIIVNEITFQQVSAHFVFRDLDRIRVKGKTHPVNIYELLDEASEKSKYEDLLSRFDVAMRAYRSQNWREAAAAFDRLLQRYPEDGPTQTFLQRSLDFIDNTPEEEWDGVYVMKSK
jgi:adenylate cyclase